MRSQEGEDDQEVFCSSNRFEKKKLRRRKREGRREGERGKEEERRERGKGEGLLLELGENVGKAHRIRMSGMTWNRPRCLPGTRSRGSGRTAATQKPRRQPLHVTAARRRGHLQKHPRPESTYGRADIADALARRIAQEQVGGSRRGEKVKK